MFCSRESLLRPSLAVAGDTREQGITIDKRSNCTSGRCTGALQDVSPASRDPLDHQQLHQQQQQQQSQASEDSGSRRRATAASGSPVPPVHARSATAATAAGMEKSVSIAFLSCFTQAVTPSMQLGQPRARDCRSLDRRWNQTSTSAPAASVGPFASSSSSRGGPASCGGTWDYTKNYKKKNDADPHRPNERRRWP